MSRLQNIIFDLGGVLLNLDFSKTTNAFRELGFPNFDDMFSQHKVDQLFEKLEKGEISDEEFYSIMLKVGNEKISREEVKTAWNSMLLDFRPVSLDYLRILGKDYKLFLLSNTNAIHLEAVNDLLKKQCNLDSLDGFFTRAYYSHLIGYRKPNADVFNFVLNDAGLKAEETFFIDDTMSNIEAAKKSGINAHLLLPEERIENLVYSPDHLISSNSI